MTGFFSKPVIYVAAIMTVALSLGGIRGEVSEKKVNLPETVGLWTRAAPGRVIDSQNIFEYMNGAGELYLGYGFDHLEVFEYASDRQDMILVEVYFMKTSNDAYGLLSMDWGGKPVPIDSTTPAFQSDPAASPRVRALYGGGLLRLWADTLYARVMAYRETTESKKAVLFLGQTIAANRKMPAEPELLKTLLETVSPAWTLRKDRIGYFRSHLVLNSLYYLSHQNILHLDHSTEAVTAPYEKTSPTKPPERIQALVVQYASAKRARKALADFHDAYLQEHQKGFDPGGTSDPMDFFNIEDGWLGYALHGKALVVVFECPDRDSARTITKQLLRHAIKKEKSHGK